MDWEDTIIIGGSFNPVGNNHDDLERLASELCHRVIIFPCGIRKDKPQTNFISDSHREKMLALNFSGRSRTRLDLFDLQKNGRFTPTFGVEERYQTERKVWHLVGADILEGAAKGESEIHRFWQRPELLFEKLHFLVATRPGYKLLLADLPPHCQIYELGISGSSSEVRKKRERDLPITGLVAREVETYIIQNNLYGKES